MQELNSQLESLRKEDADVSRILDVYDEIDRVYNAALAAMGIKPSRTDVVMSSAEVTISIQPTESAHRLTFDR